MSPQGLQLDHARALLRQEGIALPAAETPPSLQELQAIIDGLCLLSERDPLTGLPNRRAFEARAQQELDRACRTGEMALLLVVDLDHFKAINDQQGHAVGDAVLKEVARTLQRSVRPMDTVARLGGEEFAVLLPHVVPARAGKLAERVRLAVAEARVPLPQGGQLGVTASLGGALAAPWVRSTWQHWLERADRQLYAAKNAGRNRVCLEPVPHTEVSAEEKRWLLGGAELGVDRIIAGTAEAEPDLT
ncbi:putative diguanylate cyclase AdrA [Tepidimonas alkaliphilus]|uniref:diguanylate cyclase n=1 Tax=Tepidimonas alkaliphilus TaxID=2588942 RepID=A0A554WBW4_9BURK|nr:GGDEF domain-containing protein [Tepidimonas alkaliphilus]TSE21063.1 putative diguanylate cyclase AdrA [Tepidimonas alkaliphilus]